MSAFIWSPQNAVRTTKPRVRVAQFGDGYAQRLRDGIHHLADQWSLTFQGEADRMLEIDAFLRAAGGDTAFDWTAPDGRNGRWICEDWSTSPQGSLNVFQLTASFKQVFGQ